MSTVSASLWEEVDLTEFTCFRLHHDEGRSSADFA
jgi:hypothetical protein